MRAQVLADIFVLGNKPSEMFLGPFAGIGDADACVGGDLIVRYGLGAFDEEVWALAQVDACKGFVNSEGFAEFGGAVAEVAGFERPIGVFACAVSGHVVEPFGGFECPDEDGMREVDLSCGDIHAVMHAIGEVDIGGAWSGVHGLGALGAAVLMGMGRLVLGSEVGFSFDDDAGES